MQSVADGLPQRGYEQTCGIWDGHDFIPRLREMGITVMTFQLILVRSSEYILLLKCWCAKLVALFPAIPTSSLQSLAMCKYWGRRPGRWWTDGRHMGGGAQAYVLHRLIIGVATINGINATLQTRWPPNLWTDVSREVFLRLFIG